LSNKNSFDAYIQPQYTNLQTSHKDKQAEFSKELFIFLQQYPEFSKDQSQLNLLRYCFDHYINYDPSSRDLPLPDKLRRAGEMALSFMGNVIGAKADQRTE
jgi:hypothetical protein